MRMLAAAISGVLLVSCGGNFAATSGPRLPLTFQESVNGAAPSQVPAQGGLDLSNIGDVGVVTAFLGSQQVRFTLDPAPTCTGIVTISNAVRDHSRRETSRPLDVRRRVGGQGTLVS